MKLVKLLANLGYGSRKEVRRLLKSGAVTDDSGTALTGKAFPPRERIRFRGEELDPDKKSDFYRISAWRWTGAGEGEDGGESGKFSRRSRGSGSRRPVAICGDKFPGEWRSTLHSAALRKTKP